MTRTEKMPIPYQAAQMRAVVTAGPECFAARAPFSLAFGRDRATKADADADADYLDELFWNCPTHQWPIAALAGMK